jgi:GT2 family glycosyltransferase
MLQATRPPASVSAIVTAYRRIPQTLKTLATIAGASPPPAEVIVHVDGNERKCERAIRESFPSVRVLLSTANIGPGGGRNRLLEAATSPYVASFDDDSFPLQADYFARIVAIFERYPQASILAAQVVNRGEAAPADGGGDTWTSNFVGCGCAYRKSALAGLEGYVPLPIAYGMEEVDLALQVIAGGGWILSSPSVRVFHDTDFGHYESVHINAHTVANLALFVFLRYPLVYWPLGFLQVLNRVRWLINAGRRKGVLKGLALIPGHLYRLRHLRHPVDIAGFRRFRALRSSPMPAHVK